MSKMRKTQLRQCQLRNGNNKFSESYNSPLMNYDKFLVVESTDEEFEDSDAMEENDYLVETGYQIDELQEFLSNKNLDGTEGDQLIIENFICKSKIRRKRKGLNKSQKNKLKEIRLFLKWFVKGIESGRLTIYSSTLRRNKHLIANFNWQHKADNNQKCTRPEFVKTLFSGCKYKFEGESDWKIEIGKLLSQHGAVKVETDPTHIICLNVKKEILRQSKEIFKNNLYNEFISMAHEDTSVTHEGGPKYVNSEWVYCSRNELEMLDEMAFPIE